MIKYKGFLKKKQKRKEKGNKRKRKVKTRAGEAFFKYLNPTSFDYQTMVYLKILIEPNINITAYFSLRSWWFIR